MKTALIDRLTAFAQYKILRPYTRTGSDNDRDFTDPEWDWITQETVPSVLDDPPPPGFIAALPPEPEPEPYPRHPECEALQDDWAVARAASDAELAWADHMADFKRAHDIAAEQAQEQAFFVQQAIGAVALPSEWPR